MSLKIKMPLTDKAGYKLTGLFFAPKEQRRKKSNTKQEQIFSTVSIEKSKRKGQ